LLQIITREFIEKFNKLNNVIANIYIKHLLYGNQKINNCILHPFVDGERIGLNINEENIYITMDELLSTSMNDNEYVLKSEIMELYIKL
jgi:hypothetical protein